MPIISRIGRKTPKVRLLIFSMYLLLSLGGVTMVYPLALMVAGSMKGTLDVQDMDVIPKFLTQEDVFFQRYLESKYAEDKQGLENKYLTLINLNSALNTDYAEFSEIYPPQAVSPELIKDFDEFRRSPDFHPQWYWLGHVITGASNFRAFKNELIEEAGPDLVKISDMLHLKFKSWMDVRPRLIKPARVLPPKDALVLRSEEFKLKCPVEDRIIFNIHADYRRFTLKPKYSESLEDYNKKTGRNLKNWEEARITPSVPANPIDREDWEIYVRKKVPFHYLVLKPEAVSLYRKYLHSVYDSQGGVATLNKYYETNYKSMDEVPLPSLEQLMGRQFQDYNRFIQEKVPLEAIYLNTPNAHYSEFLRKRFAGNIEELRKTYSVNWSSFEDAAMPILQVDWQDFQNQKSTLRWEFIKRNYIFVMDFMARHGSALRNTIILCVLMIGSHLIFNPLAAYALSRFGLPTTYKVLLFFMATVAFPAEVMMIPSFLQLKEFGLLNSFAALILPGLVNGLQIFLLKGFFDSLPKELYEACVIDGASEMRIFWNITLPLSKPILAVNALGSFGAAYGAFFFAVIICPDEKMWTIMVWLYQLQQTSGSQAINYAALCLAAVPTLLVFTFCQRIILRGIVVPVEK